MAINKKEYRYELIKQILSGLSANEGLKVKLIMSPEEVVKMAISLADNLMNELNNEGIKQ